MSDVVYPLPRPAEDPRFTFGFIRQVAQVIAEQGFPPVDSGPDHIRLQQALFAFLYEPPQVPQGPVTTA